MSNIEVLNDIKKDMLACLNELEASPFHKRPVVKAIAQQGAAVAALAGIIKLFFSSIAELEKGNKS